jgi:hypothetical protein
MRAADHLVRKRSAFPHIGTAVRRVLPLVGIDRAFSMAKLIGADAIGLAMPSGVFE